MGKFVEFFGDGVHQLSLADRATISNMCPEYGATIGYFPVDEQALTYMRQTGRSEEQVSLVESYLRAQEMFRVYQGVCSLWSLSSSFQYCVFFCTLLSSKTTFRLARTPCSYPPP